MADVNPRLEMTADSPLTELLRRACAGDREAANQAYESVYGELCRNARRLLRSEPQFHTLDPEGLLHEAYLKLMHSGNADFSNRGHFLAVMSCAMRQHLIDHAKEKKALKRGGAQKRLPLTGIVLTFDERPVDLLALHEALTAFALTYPDEAQVVELTYFLGLTADEVAAALGTSRRTVSRDLQFARTWLAGELSR